ncbi:hypothetical protein GWO13_07245 [Candidatus Bathyarchaeota archaeon]|nr:hypothetical protein [Candidatus Bathyarchaeota archaeon]
MVEFKGDAYEAFKEHVNEESLKITKGDLGKKDVPPHIPYTPLSDLDTTFFPYHSWTCLQRDPSKYV